MLIIGMFPSIIMEFTELIGIFEPTNGLFAMAIFCIIMILMSLTAIVTKLNEKSKTLIQNVAILEKRIRELEKQTDSSDASSMRAVTKY